MAAPNGNHQISSNQNNDDAVQILLFDGLKYEIIVRSAGCILSKCLKHEACDGKGHWTIFNLKTLSMIGHKYHQTKELI